MSRRRGLRQSAHGAGWLLVALAGSGAPLPREAAAALVTAPLQQPAPEPLHAPVLAPAPAALGLPDHATQGALLRGIAPPDTRLTLDGQPIPLASDGAFIIAFDRDAKPLATLIATDGAGRRTIRAIAIIPRAWDIQSLPTLPRGTTPTPEFLRRRAEELRQINAARAAATDAAGWRDPFLWPATGRISGVFGSQRIYAGEPGAYHAGVDIARPAGTPVVAPADGVVILAAAAPFTLEGNLLMIDHGMGLNSAFLHLSHILVATGAHVARGQLIGLIGMTGRATGPHLHWAVKWHGARIDPALLAGAMPGARAIPARAEPAGD